MPCRHGRLSHGKCSQREVTQGKLGCSNFKPNISPSDVRTQLCTHTCHQSHRILCFTYSPLPILRHSFLLDTQYSIFLSAFTTEQGYPDRPRAGPHMANWPQNTECAPTRTVFLLRTNPRHTAHQKSARRPRSRLLCTHTRRPGPMSRRLIGLDTYGEERVPSCEAAVRSAIRTEPIRKGMRPE
ncbi:hypothetical protein C8Q74DRAFT_116128 [Fomes fomentarius]|nr:hypothetical protein C8Q74DRAFT_116128 [Fomes fomentarius]